MLFQSRKLKTAGGAPHPAQQAASGCTPRNSGLRPLTPRNSSLRLLHSTTPRATAAFGRGPRATAAFGRGPRATAAFGRRSYGTAGFGCCTAPMRAVTEPDGTPKGKAFEAKLAVLGRLPIHVEEYCKISGSHRSGPRRPVGARFGRSWGMCPAHFLAVRSCAVPWAPRGAAKRDPNCRTHQPPPSMPTRPTVRPCAGSHSRFFRGRKVVRASTRQVGVRR